MNIPASRSLKIGRILDETFEVIERNGLAVLAFVVAVSLANGALAYFGFNYTAPFQQVAKGLIGFLIGVGAGFLLLTALLRQGGMLKPDADEPILAFLGLSILTTLGVLVGFLLIVFPGLYLMARWSIAQPLLIVRGGGVIEAMKGSWERTAGSEFSIIIIFLVIVVLQAGTSFVIGQSFAPDNLAGIAIAQVVSSVTTVIGASLAVALYRLLAAQDIATAAKTFE